MKQRFCFVRITILMAVVIAIATGCGNDDNDNSKEPRYLKKLSGTWVLEHATLDDTDVTALFDDLVLTVNTDNTYRVMNGMPPYFPPEGAFRLMAADQSERYKMVRDDGMEMGITILSEETLQLSLAYVPNTSGRVSSISGEYEFVFQRQ